MTYLDKIRSLNDLQLCHFLNLIQGDLELLGLALKLSDNPEIYCSHDEFEGTLAAAKAEADENVCYTQQNIDIIDKNDVVVATRKWWGVEYDENNEDMYEEDPISYGKFGYYTSWIDF